jgi:hypothetical protein
MTDGNNSESCPLVGSSLLIFIYVWAIQAKLPAVRITWRKGFGRKRAEPNFMYYPSICLYKLRKTMAIRIQNRQYWGINPEPFEHEALDLRSVANGNLH